MSRADADRNLLFGVFALNHQFVSSDALIAALDAWIDNKDRPLAEVLVEQGALPASRRSMLEPLVEEHIARHDGDPALSLAALSSLGTARSALESIDDPGVRATLASLGPFDPNETTVEAFDPVETTVEAFDPSETIVDATDPSSVFAGIAAGGPPAVDRRFRILRPHARGGLGEVFLAEDTELRREVALKQIRDRLADDPESRARFVLEAEITGNLEHPGIVPIYGLGHYPDGRPFYAMRFIKGDNLAVEIARFRGREASADDPGALALAFRGLLGRFIDVCDVMTYAHMKGVLHRDLKPENVMLGRYGQTIVVDWGLAKAAGVPGPEHDPDERPVSPSSASGTAETLPGSVLGTPCYMSPEQARGELDALGPASDIYSLGATLYTLLTGRRAFDEPERADLLRKVREGDFPTPRRIRPEIPRPLEAICLKAMAPRPEDRYRSAKALAVDVERWMADEPVSAWREPIAIRARRWVSRHRTLVASLTVAMAILLLGGGLMWSQARVRAALDRERAAALVERLGTAEVSSLPALIPQVSALRPRIDAPLRVLRERAPAGSQARWIASVALLAAVADGDGDPALADEVLDHALSDAAEPEELEALGRSAAQLGPGISDRLRAALEQPPTASTWPRWLRAATIAEASDPADPSWGLAAEAIARRLAAEGDPEDRYALILALGSVPDEVVDDDGHRALLPTLLGWYRADPDPGVHAVIGWLLRRRWDLAEQVREADRALAADGPVDDRRWFVGPDGQAFVVVPGGEIALMGTPAGLALGEAQFEHPPHRRRIGRSFAIAATEVTWGQYRRFLEDTDGPLGPEDQGSYAPGDDAPAIMVSWPEAVRYCNWLSRREGLEPCYPDDVDPEEPPDAGLLGRSGYRLPTEGEWEYACRAGTTTLHPFGDGIALLGRFAWWSGNSADDSMPHGGAHPVGSKPPNRLGLFDLLGNVAEWCHDPYRPYPDPPGDEPIDDARPPGDPEPMSRVLRGGHFASPGFAVRAAIRDFQHPVFFNTTCGFRVVRTLADQPAAVPGTAAPDDRRASRGPVLCN